MSVIDSIQLTAIYERRPLRLALGLAIILNVTLWLVVVFSPPARETIVPLHYNIYFGIDLFAEWQKIYSLPISGAAILVINTLLALTILRREVVLTTFTVVSSILTQLILLAALVLILSQVYYS